MDNGTLTGIGIGLATVAGIIISIVRGKTKQPKSKTIPTQIPPKSTKVKEAAERISNERFEEDVTEINEKTELADRDERLQALANMKDE